MPNFTHPAFADASLLFLRTWTSHLFYLSGPAFNTQQLGPLTLGVHAAIQPNMPADTPDGDGRMIQFLHNSAASYTVQGTLNHVAFVDQPGSRILNLVEVKQPFQVVVGEPIRFDAPFVITQPRFTE